MSFFLYIISSSPLEWRDTEALETNSTNGCMAGYGMYNHGVRLIIKTDLGTVLSGVQRRFIFLESFFAVSSLIIPFVSLHLDSWDISWAAYYLFFSARLQAGVFFSFFHS